MSVPLDRLYHYLADCVNHDLLIYRWLPLGSRKLEDLKLLKDYTKNEFLNSPVVIYHDQEPLNYNFYSNSQFRDVIESHCVEYNQLTLLKDSVLDYIANLHLRSITSCLNQHDVTILVHSEQHSQQIAQFQQVGFVPVYYWSHAIIALDWFRYAEHDPVLKFNPAIIEKDFLVYNRAWSGTREYRLCFAEQVVQQQIVAHCKMSFNAVDHGHYGQHQFVNPEFQITNYNLSDIFPINVYTADASADYCGIDYATTGIEVVLETLFDDSRWHLTEKSLRPIACGSPFILMATAGSLQYLKKYGFETFDGLIDESYDSIPNAKIRLHAVIAEMQRIAGLDQIEKQRLYINLNEIAQRNKQRFFNGLFDQVIKEYQINIAQGLHLAKQHCTGKHLAQVQAIIQQN